MHGISKKQDDFIPGLHTLQRKFDGQVWLLEQLHFASSGFALNEHETEQIIENSNI